MILVIPDIHHKTLRADIIIRHEQPDKVIFLGDYFDDFGDSRHDAQDTANWLLSNIDNPNYIFLFGNHDISYSYSNRWAKCAGYSQDKDIAINEIMNQYVWNKFKWFHFEENFLFSHAGVHLDLLESKMGKGRSLSAIKDYLNKESSNAFEALASGNKHWFFQAGYIRGGCDKIGGLVWCDKREFKGIPGLKQIVGHTPIDEPKNHEDVIFLDTHLNHYLLINDKKEITIHRYHDIPHVLTKQKI